VRAGKGESQEYEDVKERELFHGLALLHHRLLRIVIPGTSLAGVIGIISHTGSILAQIQQRLQVDHPAAGSDILLEQHGRRCNINIQK
jgi:hypothetical protein